MKKWKKIILCILLLCTCIQLPVSVKANEGDAMALLQSIQNVPPTMSEEGTLILPKLTNDQYVVRLAGSSNEAVIGLDGKVHTPISTMSVRLMYQVVNKEDENDTAFVDDKAIDVLVDGSYPQTEHDNAKPNVIPGLREWKGMSGKYQLMQQSRIVVNDASLIETGEQIAYYFKEMLNKQIPVVAGTPVSGDIFLQLTKQNAVLGSEGYTIVIDDQIKIEANEVIGILYGGTSITQILSQDEQKKSVPKGIIRDYPEYKVRSGMLDVARFYMPLSYLEEMTKYMAYFKMNQVHLHINDDGGEQYASLRVESKKYPALNSGLKQEEVYSQEDYKAYQKTVAEYGIDVVTEIDTPAHARFINLHDPSLMLDDSHIDLSKPEAVAFMQSLYDEFLDGDDPVFQSDTFHIGADEYKRESQYAEDFLKYVDTMVKYINDKGLHPRMWASLGGGGINGTTPVDNRVTANYWAYSWADFPKMLRDGYRCINTSTDLYIVPGTSTGYEDYINLDKLYENWEVYTLGGGTNITSAHPLLDGAQSALWYDRKVGSSQFDYFDRFRDQIMLISEKTWFGERQNDQTSEQFAQRIKKVDKKAPGANPARYVESQSETIVNYDFETITNQTIQDTSGNRYDGTLHGIQVNASQGDHFAELDGSGHISMPFNTVGFPYTVSFDIYIDESTPEDAVLFKGDDGVLYLNYKGSGKIGYERKGYQYIIQETMETNRWYNVVLSCDNFFMNLYIDDVFAASASYADDLHTKPESSTFVLPTQEIGKGVIGMLDNFHIQNRYVSYEEMMGMDSLDYKNVALHKTVSVSRLEVDGKWTGDMVVDGDSETRVSLYPVDDAWLMVDLEDVYMMDKIEIDFNERPNKYQIWVSENGEDWTMVHEDLECVGKPKGTDMIPLTVPMQVRYVKYQQLERFSLPAGGQYSGNFTELKVYAFAGITALQNVLQEAEKLLLETTETELNNAYVKRFKRNIAMFEECLDKGTMEEKCWMGKQLSQQIADLKNNFVQIPDVDTVKLEALLAYEINESYYDTETIENFKYMQKNARYAYMDIHADQAKIDSAEKKLKSCIDELKDNKITVTANKDVYLENNLSNAVDGNLQTSLWIKGSQEIGDYIQFAFRYPFMLSDIRVIAKSAGMDILEGADIEVSDDGENWEKVGLLTKADDQKIAIEEQQVQYVRFLVTVAANHWTRIDEVQFNTVQTAALEELLSQIFDSALYTTDSYAVYTNAKEHAQKVLDRADKTQQQVDEAVQQLQQAMDQLLYKKADYTNVQNALISIPEDLEIYTEESKGILQQAIDAVIYELDITKQKQVDAYAAAIVNAVQNLVVRDDNEFVKTILKGAIIKAEAVIRTGQIDKLAPKVKEMIMVAYDEAVIVYDQKNASIEQCLTVWIALPDALQWLNFTADKTTLNAIISEYSKLNLDDYIEGVEEFRSAMQQAIAVYNDEDALQERIDEAIARLEKAVEGLVKKDEVNKIVLQKMIESIQHAIQDDDQYKKDEHWSAFKEVLVRAESVLEDQKATQSDVIAAVHALAGAYENIRLLPSEEQLAQMESFLNAQRNMNRMLYKNDQLQEIDELAKDVASMLHDFDSKQWGTLSARLNNIQGILNIVENKPVLPINEQEINTIRDIADNSNGSSSLTVNGIVKTGDVTHMSTIMLALFIGTGCMYSIYKKKNRKQ